MYDCVVNISFPFAVLWWSLCTLPYRSHCGVQQASSITSN